MEFGEETRYPLIRGSSSKPLLGGGSGPSGVDGKDARFPLASTQNIMIPCDSDGSNPVFTDANIDLEIWDGGIIIGQSGDAKGWSTSAINAINCSVFDATAFEASITTISADFAQFTMQFVRSGDKTLYLDVKVYKVKAGVKGDQGDQGDIGLTGPTGPTGPAGDPGSGLVVVKKVIKVISPTTLNVTADNSGGLRFAATHELEEGDTVEHTGFTNSSYNGLHKVSVIDSSYYRIADVAYVSDDSGSGYYRSSIMANPNDDPQNLVFLDIVPPYHGLVEQRIIQVTSMAEEYLEVYLGYNENPTTGWNYWLNASQAMGVAGNVASAPQTGNPYNIQPIDLSKPNRWIRVQTENEGDYWTDNYNLKLNLFIAYIAYNPSEYYP